MTAPAAELQKAVFAALCGDPSLVAMLGGPKIHDQAPANVVFPYLTFGRTSVYDWSTDTESGTEQLFSIHVWSKAQGKRETLEIMEAVRVLLDDARLDLGSQHLVSMRLEFSEARFDDRLTVHHGVLRFRAVTEPVA
ncbi:DUF3168 domain-containing protein [Aminobacter sp. HY435]|uniref:DUF3168 domain-containing protein n=1 Tax=Aminobacter sp. HY435 TaxID=2970917 RepID=UPI0022B96E9D|nr:DUF3168 domain-containing protein [Aminobacter sp. HY435]